MSLGERPSQKVNGSRPSQLSFFSGSHRSVSCQATSDFKTDFPEPCSLECEPQSLSQRRHSYWEGLYHLHMLLLFVQMRTERFRHTKGSLIDMNDPSV